MSRILTVVLCESRGKDPQPSPLQKELTAALAGRAGVALRILPHLYDLAPEGPGMEFLRGISGDLIVAVSLYSRAARWLLAANGIEGRVGRSPLAADAESESADSPSGDGNQRTIWCFDLRQHIDAAALLKEIERIAAEAADAPGDSVDSGTAAAGPQEARIDEQTQFRWYPVVDYDRCENCLECLNFCLFGVFNVDESGQLFIEQPDACRDGCPACARVCPSQAIIFPHHATPAIAGDSSAPAETYNPGLVQLALGSGLNPQQLANAERDKAIAERDKAAEDGEDALDRLVDELDEADL